MEPKLPESSFINPFHKVEGTPKEARASFYELAKDKIKYLSRDEVKKWHEEVAGIKGEVTSAAFVINRSKDDNLDKWIYNLEIIVNKDAFNRDGKNYSDLMPFVIEHEIYETWLKAKKGTGSKMEDHKQHLLARRRQYLLAEQQGLGDKLFEWDTLTGFKDKSRTEFEYALRVAKKQLQGKK